MVYYKYVYVFGFCIYGERDSGVSGSGKNVVFIGYFNNIRSVFVISIFSVESVYSVFGNGCYSVFYIIGFI